MKQEKLDHALELIKMDYQITTDAALKLEHTKLIYQRYFISLVTAIGTISIAFLKFKFLDNSSLFSIENLIGLLLIFSAILGYIITRNLVSIRRQCIWYINSIIYFRKKLILEFGLTDKTPQLKEVAGNEKDSADYITINLFSLVVVVMLIIGFALFIGELLEPIYMSCFTGVVVIIYGILHYHTIEKALKK